MENLLARWFEKWQHLQIITHRGRYFTGMGLLENSVVGRPVLIRRFRNNNFTPEKVPSCDYVMSTADHLDKAYAILPNGTFFADCQNNDVSFFEVFLSKSRTRHYMLMMFYTFIIDSGEKLAEKIDKHDFHVNDMESEVVQHAVLAELAIVEVVKWAKAFSEFKYLKIGARTHAYDVLLPQNDGIRKYFTYDLKSGHFASWSPVAGLRKIKGLYATLGQTEITIQPDFIITDTSENAHYSCCDISADASLEHRHLRFDAIRKD